MHCLLLNGSSELICHIENMYSVVIFSPDGTTLSSKFCEKQAKIFSLWTCPLKMVAIERYNVKGVVDILNESSDDWSEIESKSQCDSSFSQSEERDRDDSTEIVSYDVGICLLLCPGF